MWFAKYDIKNTSKLGKVHRCVFVFYKLFLSNIISVIIEERAMIVIPINA